MRLLLENYAFDSKEAEDGLEALALLDEGLLVNVILPDYHMPVITVMNLLRALAYRVNGQEIHVILLSANLTKEMERIAIQAGAFAIMAKPYDPEKLLAIVSQAWHRPIS